MTPDDLRAVFPSFYGNPHIQELAAAPRWTVSTTKASEEYRTKMPLDIRAYFYGGVSKDGKILGPGVIRGAFATDETCLFDLDELTTRLPEASNCAFYLQSSIDEYLVLDIEPTCPPAEAARLLAMPGALYVETSMSGKGFHLLMPVPKNFWDYPIAANKRVLKHPQGWWEILLEHWITFTRYEVSDVQRARMEALAPATPPTWEQVWEELADSVVASHSASVLIEAAKPGIPYEELLIKAVVSTGHGRDPKDFNHDLSRFEFSVLGVYLHRIEDIVANTSLPGVDPAVFDDSMLAWIVYLAATKGIPHRLKHTETRNGLPFLLSQAQALISRRRGDEQQEAQYRTTKKKDH